MHTEKLLALLLLVAPATSTTFTQAPQSPPPGPTFEVVSIKRSTASFGPGFTSSVTQRPDGGFAMTNQPVSALFTLAYPMTAMVGPPT